MLKFWYFTGVFFVIRSLCLYPFKPVTLTWGLTYFVKSCLLFNSECKNFHLSQKCWLWLSNFVGNKHFELEIWHIWKRNYPWQNNKYDKLSYCTCTFPITRTFYWHPGICPCELGIVKIGRYRRTLCFLNTSCCN